MKKLYIAGPINAVGPPTYNRPAFYRAAGRLRQYGYEPVNPHDVHEMPAGVLPWEEYMKADLAALLRCDGVATLDGWAQSRGAKVEVRLAGDLNIPVNSVEGWVFEKLTAKRVKDEKRAKERLSDTPPLGQSIMHPDCPDSWLSPAARSLRKALIAKEKKQFPLVSVEKPEPSVTLEAHGLVNGQRQSDYGHPLDNFTQIGQMWAAILGVPEVTAEQVGLMMVATKVSRQCHRPKRDNLVDMAGYAETVDMVVNERERRSAQWTAS